MVDIAWSKRIIIISDQLNSIQRIIIMPITRHTVERFGIVTTPHGRVRFPTIGTANRISKIRKTIVLFRYMFPEQLSIILHRSLARTSALTEASLRLHWRSKYLNLALVDS